MVERHSMAPTTRTLPHSLERVVSCAASQTAGWKSSTSSQRSFWTRVPRTEVWDWARISVVGLVGEGDASLGDLVEHGGEAGAFEEVAEVGVHAFGLVE
jgi:hypothetical protein